MDVGDTFLLTGSVGLEHSSHPVLGGILMPSRNFEVKNLPDNNRREATQAYTPPEMVQKLFNIMQSLATEYENTQLSNELKSAVFILLQQFIATALKFSPKIYQEELLIIDRLNQLTSRRRTRDEWNLIPVFMSYQGHQFGITIHWAPKT